MVLTDRQRADLHAGIYEYLLAQARATAADEGECSEAFARAAAALHDADPEACSTSRGQQQPPQVNGVAGTNNSSSGSSAPGKASSAPVSSTSSTTPLLEKKWVAIPRLQKKVMELERLVAQSAKIHAHRATSSSSSTSGGAELDAKALASGGRRMLPRQPYLHKLTGHSAVVTCVAVHPVFTLAASGSEDGTIKIWDHESGEFLKTLKGHTNTVNGLDFTPRGTHLASCSTDLSIKLWDLTSRNGNHQQQQQYVCVRTLRGHDHTISAVRFLPLFSSAAMLAEQRGSENQKQRPPPPSSSSASVAASAGANNGGVLAAAAGCQYLLSASRDATVKMWDVETGFCDHTVSDHSDWVRCLAVQMHPKGGGDGGTSGGGGGGGGGIGSSSTVWASAGNDAVIYVYEGRKPVMELRGHEHVVESLAFLTEEPFRPASSSSSSSRESKHSEAVRDYLASGSRDRTVRLWKLSEAACLATFVAHENWVRSVLIHPSGNYVISASDDKTIRVFDVAGKRCLRVLEKAHDHFVTSIAMHHTLPILVSGGVDQTVRCWQLD